MVVIIIRQINVEDFIGISRPRTYFNLQADRHYIYTKTSAERFCKRYCLKTASCGALIFAFVLVGLGTATYLLSQGGLDNFSTAQLGSNERLESTAAVLIAVNVKRKLCSPKIE